MSLHSSLRPLPIKHDRRHKGQRHRQEQGKPCKGTEFDPVSFREAQAIRSARSSGPVNVAARHVSSVQHEQFAPRQRRPWWDDLS